MNNFPKGNDLIVKWAIKYSDGTPFPLENYAWELCYSAGRGINVVKDTAVISVSDNLLTWRFSGKDQAFYGKYSLTLRLYQQGKIVATVSKTNAFELSTTQYDGPCDIDLVSYCDNISLQDALLRGNKAMEVARSADTTSQGAKTVAAEAKTLAAEAKSNSTQAVTTANTAKTTADQAKATADATAATATQKAEEVAQKEAQLEAALNNLSTDQSGALALSTKVNEQGDNILKLEQDTIKYEKIDGTIGTKSVGKYVRYSDGVIVDTSSPFEIYKIILNGEYDSIRIHCAYSDSASCAIAFYNSIDTYASTYLKDDSLQGFQANQDYFAIVPKNAKIAVITNRYGTMATPVVSLYKDNSVVGLKESITSIKSDLAGYEIDFSLYSDNERSFIDGTKWLNNGNYTGNLIKVNPGQKFLIKGNSVNGSNYSFLKDNVVSYGSIANFASGYAGAIRVNADSMVEVESPSDANYLYVCRKYGGANRTPIVTIHGFEDSIISAFETRSAIINPFTEKPIIHHLGVEQGSSYMMQSQSINDIFFAKACGANVIEANVHKCSDGVYVVKHGQGGKLGYGLKFAQGSTLTSETPFSSVTSTQLRNEVSYSTHPNAPQYTGVIPTLGEFCSVCKQIGMSVLLQVTEPGVLNEARKYLSDDQIITYGLADRGDFKGMMMEYYSSSDVNAVLQRAKKCRRPYLFSWANYYESTDSIKRQVIDAMHQNGFFVGASYGGVDAVMKALKNGIDCVASTFLTINPMSLGTSYNLHLLNDNHYTLENASYNSSEHCIDILQGGKITLIDNEFEHILGSMTLKIRYRGNLSIMSGYGNQWTSFNSSVAYINRESDGVEMVILPQATMSHYLLRIVANADTKIYEMHFVASKVY